MTFFTHSSHMLHDIKCTMQSGGSKNIDLLTDSPEPLAAAGSAWQTSLRSPQHGTGACMCVCVRVYVDVCMHACVSSGIGVPMFRYCTAQVSSRNTDHIQHRQHRPRLSARRTAAREFQPPGLHLTSMVLAGVLGMLWDTAPSCVLFG